MPSTAASLELRVGAKTHPGKIRHENQDRMGRFRTPVGELFVVADGIGGHEGGAMAAAMTSDGFDTYLKSVLPGTPPHEALQQAAQHTNAEIYRLANAGDPATARMGSTVVLALVSGQHMVIGHAGDSRAYLFQANRLVRLTRDHSLVQKMLDQHMLTEEEARHHPDASVINRAFGQQPELELEVSSLIELHAGDGVLLCSDGLCGYVNDGEIEHVIRQRRDAQATTDALIDLALTAGGEDNVTVQFLWFGQSTPLTAETPTERLDSSASRPLTVGENRPRHLSHLTMAFLLVGAFLLGMLAVYVLGLPKILRQRPGDFATPPAIAPPSTSPAPGQPSIPAGEQPLPASPVQPDKSAQPENAGGDQPQQYDAHRATRPPGVPDNREPTTLPSGTEVTKPEQPPDR